LHILQVTEASGAGTFAVVRTLAAGLAAAGDEVTIAYGRRPETPSDPAAGLPDGVDLVELPWNGRTAAAQFAAARALRRLVRERTPDVVHLHSSFAGAVGAAAIGRRVPCVYSPHGYAFAREGVGRAGAAAYRLAEWWTARRCALVGAVSHAEAALARTALRAPRVAVVPNGIAELDEGRLPTPPRRDRQLVAGIGRIDSQRRPAASARILAALAGTADVRWIGGAARGEDAPLRAAGVEVTGWLPHDVALEHLAQATVCLHWSGSDANPIAVLEAMARDVVVVASDIPANRELLGARQVCGDERRAVALAGQVLRDPALRADLLADQRRRREPLSATRMVAAWRDAYARVLDERRAPTRCAPPLAPTIKGS
jgi:glycosyltransferase involved in cell wall biosynthesis